MTAYAGEVIESIPGGTELNTRSVSFSGAGSYLSISHAAQTDLDPTGEFSIIASSRPSSLPASGAYYTIASKWGSAAGDKSYQFALVEAAGSHYLVLKWQDSAIRTATSPAAVSPSTSVWSRYAVCFEDPGSGATWNVYFYEDGTLVGAAPVAAGDRTTPIVVGTAAFHIGETAASADAYSGNLDDIHFWKGQALSSTSVNAWLETMANGYEGMSAYWTFEGSEGDRSPNGNDLNYVNAFPAVHSPYASFSDIRITAADWDDYIFIDGDKYRYAEGDVVKIGTPRDDVPPYIANVTPTPGLMPGTRAQAKETPIEFDVIDESPGLRIVMITIKLAGDSRKFVVHDGSDFVYPYDSSDSTRTTTTNGYHFKVLPRTGWTENIDEMWVYALDAHGNLEGTLP